MIEAVGLTDVGRRRKLNEDAFLILQEPALFAVCDGMGGHNAGEVASKMAIETLQAFVERSEKEKEITWPYGLDANLSFDGNRLKTALKLANKKVFRAADNREEYTGMGTTAVVALVRDGLLTLIWAGDSRCYLLRGESFEQLTRDDSWVAAALGEGILSEQEIEHHPLRNVITKAVGAKDSIDSDVVERKLESGDVLLLCSDGLHSMISDGTIHALLAASATAPEQATRALVDAANEAGGKDNVTTVVIRYSD